jgi:hypothetical protein
MFPLPGVPTPTGDADDDGEDDDDEHAVAEYATRSGVAGQNSAALRSSQYGDGTAGVARSKSARLDLERLGMKRSL